MRTVSFLQMGQAIRFSSLMVDIPHRSISLHICPVYSRMFLLNVSACCSPFSILASASSHCPVISALAICLSLTMSYTASPLSVGIKFFLSRRIYSRIISVSMMLALDVVPLYLFVVKTLSSNKTAAARQAFIGLFTSFFPVFYCVFRPTIKAYFCPLLKNAAKLVIYTALCPFFILPFAY